MVKETLGEPLGKDGAPLPEQRSEGWGGISLLAIALIAVFAVAYLLGWRP
jgi:hypothetical protein